jgi:hypothetical protein
MAEPEDEEQPGELTSVLVVRGRAVEREVALYERKRKGVGLDVLGDDVCGAGIEGPVAARPEHRETQPPTTMNAITATQTQPLSPSPLTACEPKNEV